MPIPLDSAHPMSSYYARDVWDKIVADAQACSTSDTAVDGGYGNEAEAERHAERAITAIFDEAMSRDVRMADPAFAAGYAAGFAARPLIGA